MAESQRNPESFDVEAGVQATQLPTDGIPAVPESVSACRTSKEARFLATLSWSDLVVTVHDAKGKEKQILKGVNGIVEPSHMLAIMAPSGGGKSTLLDALSSRLPGSAKVEGQILVNGHKTVISYGRSAYVTQDDVLIGALTVREAVSYAARLRLPKDMSQREKDAIVDGVLADLGLTDAANTFIGDAIIRGISGGQKRRVSIGCELVTQPQLIFLDEPTSGLDAAAAYYVMAAVRELARSCRTIAAVIHQPSSEVFDLFDQLCLLSGGSLVYYGEAAGAVQHFADAGVPVPPHRNPADHFLHAINKDFSEVEDVESRIRCLVDYFDRSEANKQMKQRVAELTEHPGEPFLGSQPPPPGWYQTAVLTQRNLLNNGRNVSVFWLRLGMYVMLCLALGLIYLNMGKTWSDVFNRMALLFFVVAFLTFMAIAGFPAFTEDMRVFIRERLNGYYSVSTFVVANTLSSIPFIFLIAALSTIVMYFWTNLDTDGVRVPYFILNLFLALLVVESLMMAIAPIVPHYLMGIAAGAGLLGLFMLVCGFFKSREDLTKPVFLWPLYYISFHTYSLHGMMQNEFGGAEGFACPCSVQSDGCINPDCTISGDEILTIYGYYGYNKWIDLAILMGMATIYRSIFYVTLKIKERMSMG